MSLERAIATLEAEVAAFKPGTADQPRENTEEWFLLRAKSLSLSMLRRMQQLDLSLQPREAERFYRNCSQYSKLQKGGPNAEPGGPPA